MGKAQGVKEPLDVPGALWGDIRGVQGGGQTQVSARKAPFPFGNKGDIPASLIWVRAQLLPSAGATSQLSPEPGHAVCGAGSGIPALGNTPSSRSSAQSRELPMLELPGPIPGSPGIPPCPFAPFGPIPPGPLSPGPTPLGPNPGIPGKFPGKPGTTGSPSMQSRRYSSETKQGFSSSARIPPQGAEGGSCWEWE